jgi:hypothetical protein
VWLPRFHDEGRGDSWNRFDPDAAGPAGPEYSRNSLGYLFRFLLGVATSASDWRDRTSFRLPHVRNRVARLRLNANEGGLNIGMGREQILTMAYRYGTKAGQLFVERFAEKHGQPSRQAREQRWVRLELLINGLRERLTGFSTSAAWTAHAVPMDEAVRQAVHVGPIKDTRDSNRLTPKQADSLEGLIGELERLERVLAAAESQPFKPRPEPEFRLRAPL